MSKEKWRELKDFTIVLRLKKILRRIYDYADIKRERILYKVSYDEDKKQVIIQLKKPRKKRK